MVTLAKKTLSNHERFKEVALRLDGDDWVSWMPDSGHPLFDRVSVAAVRIWPGLRRTKRIAGYALPKDRQGYLRSVLFRDPAQGYGPPHLLRVWTKSTSASFLPRTERIPYYGSEDQEPVMVPWEKVVEVAGNLMTPLEMYPERYEVAEFPTVEQLAAMGNKWRGGESSPCCVDYPHETGVSQSPFSYFD